jgi:hypothetical protein
VSRLDSFKEEVYDGEPELLESCSGKVCSDRAEWRVLFR